MYYVLIFQMNKLSFWYWCAGKCLQTNSLEKNFKVLLYSVCPFPWYKHYHAFVQAIKVTECRVGKRWTPLGPCKPVKAGSNSTLGSEEGKYWFEVTQMVASWAHLHFYYRQSSNWSESCYLQKQKFLYICKVVRGNSHPCIQAEVGATLLPHGPYRSLCFCSGGSVSRVKSILNLGADLLCLSKQYISPTPSKRVIQSSSYFQLLCTYSQYLS